MLNRLTTFNAYIYDFVLRPEVDNNLPSVFRNLFAVCQAVSDIQRDGIFDVFDGFILPIAAANTSRKRRYRDSIAVIRVIGLQNNRVLARQRLRLIIPFNKIFQAAILHD